MASDRDDNVQEEQGGQSEETAQLQAKLAEVTGDLQRVQADFVNFRRRAEAERAEVFELAKAKVAHDFLSVRDSFDRELALRPGDVPEAWAKTIDSVRAQFDQVLSRLGVERFQSQGQPFDPHLHEAVGGAEGDGPEEIVAEELQAGYKLGEQVLRHAMVRVGRGVAHEAASGQEEVIEVIEDEKKQPEDVHPDDEKSGGRN